MKRVAEIMYIVESEREEFIKGATNPDEETLEVLWCCGVRRQQYFSLNEFIFMTFEYEGNDFVRDMGKMASYLDSKGLLVNKRRKDVPVELRKTTNWWAPVKKIGDGLLLNENPIVPKEGEYSLTAALDGTMAEGDYYNDLSYSEDDWTDSFHF